MFPDPVVVSLGPVWRSFVLLRSRFAVPLATLPSWLNPTHCGLQEKKARLKMKKKLEAEAEKAPPRDKSFLRTQARGLEVEWYRARDTGRPHSTLASIV